MQAGDTSRYLEAYQTLARQLRICIVPGTIVSSVSDDDGGSSSSSSKTKAHLVNTAHFISSTGTILHSYRKKNIWHPERAYLTSSRHEAHGVFETPLGVKAGMLICWDLAFPEAFRELIAAGAELIIIPTFCTYTHTYTYKC